MGRQIEFISIGAVTRAFGIKGELEVIPLTDEPEQFCTLKTIYLNFNGNREIYLVQRIRFVRDKIILKLDHIDDRTTAQYLQGAFIERKLHELRALAHNEYFIFDLIGLKVKNITGEFIGELLDVMTLPANDVYVVKSGEKELLIPAIKDVIKHIDLDQGEIIIDPIDGLLD